MGWSYMHIERHWFGDIPIHNMPERKAQCIEIWDFALSAYVYLWREANE